MNRVVADRPPKAGYNELTLVMASSPSLKSSPLDSVVITDELRTRARRSVEYRAVSAALTKLAQTLANDPESVLQRLAEMSLELCKAHSAGVSILTQIDGNALFRWDAVAGQFRSFLYGTLPREFSPCGTVLDTNALQLMRHPERHFFYLSDINPQCAEVLLIPFRVKGKTVGTIWVVAHDEGRKFDACDAEVMQILGEFAAAAYTTVTTQSELKRALDETKTNESIARGAMESNPDCVKVLDLDGRILAMNENGCRIMEVDDFSAIRNCLWTELWREPEKQKAITAVHAARDGNANRFAGVCCTAKGNEKFWEVTVSPILNTGGKPTRLLSIARDVTVQRLEEARLRETSRLESLGVLAGGIAHDFNNLLTGILGNASLLQMSANPDDAPLATEIVKAAERAADLTRQMLAYSGKGRFVNERVDLSAAIRRIVGFVSATINKKVDVALSLDENPRFVEADPTQIDQLIMNVVLNAAESIGENNGTIAISTRVVDADNPLIAQTFNLEEPSLLPGRYVETEVRDTGCGMSEETLSRIFEPFFTTKFTGRGLGLAAVAGILRGHRGAVQVRSRPGRGTTFRIFLPGAPPLPAALAPDSTGLSLPVGCDGTILFVDDEETVRRVAKTTLEAKGFELLLAENGKEAIDLFRANRDAIRLIIVDLTMPVMGGEETIAVLRGMDPQIPILLSSGYSRQEISERFDGQIIRGFVQKPYSASRLSETVLQVLQPGLG